MAQMSDAKAKISRETMGLPLAYRAPAAGIEAQVAEGFATAFGLDSVGADDDFYDLGGDSLIGEAVSLEILQRTGETFQMSWLFEHGSPAKVAKKLNSGKAPETYERPPIFLVHGKAGVTQPRPTFYEGLAPDQKLVLFEVPGLRGGAEYETIEEIAAVYVGELQSTYPKGPVLLGAFCTGALIAIEMAAQLSKAGRPVHHMVLLDPGIPATLTDRHRREAEAQGKTVVRLMREEGPKADRRALILKTINFLATGRFSNLSTPEDFANVRVRRMTMNCYNLVLRIETWRRKLLSRNARKRAVWDMNPRTRAKLHAAYRHYWPGVYQGPVDVIASAQRRVLMEDPSQIWQRIMPNRKVRITGEKHHDVIGATGGQVSSLMQQLFDESLKSAPAARQAEVA